MSLSSALFPGVKSAGPVLIGFNAGSNLAIKSVAQGDADANGSVNVNDVTALIQGLFNIGVRTPAMDCNWDGKYSAADVVCTVRAIFGLTTP
jgi:hypothetical protein